MTLGYDQAIAMPIVDLYDDGMMSQYINAVREQYRDNQNQFKDFINKYDDFYSPFYQDNQDYYNMTIGGAKKMMDDAQKNGIDLLRSPEGRALINQYISSRPYGDIAKLKMSAKMADQYAQNRAALQRAGKFSKEYEDWLLDQLGLPSYESWSTLKDGVWNRQSPEEYKTLQQYSLPTFEGLQPHMLDQAEVLSRGYQYDPNYDYTGITRGDMRKSFDAAASSMMGDNLYRFYRERAKNELINEGIQNPTEEQIDDRFANNAITSNAQIYSPFDRKLNPVAQMNIKDAIDDANRNAEFAHDRDMAILNFKLDERARQNAEARAARKAQATAAGGGGEGMEAPPMTLDQEMLFEQLKREQTRNKDIKDSVYKKESQLYNKLGTWGKTRVNEYQSLRNKGNKRTKEENRRLNELESIGGDFAEWRRYYNYKRDIAGGGTSTYQLFRTSSSIDRDKHGTFSLDNSTKFTRDQFDKYHNIPLNDQGQRDFMISKMGVQKDKYGAYHGTIRGTEGLFDYKSYPLYGGRQYTYNSEVSKINRALKGAKYIIPSSQMSGIQFGAGSHNKKNYTQTVVKATFDGSDVPGLDNFSDKALNRYGITRSGDKQSGYKYIVPISGVYNVDNIPDSYINTRYDKARGVQPGAYSKFREAQNM